MATKLQIRNDTTENWLLVNPVLEKGEPGYESSTNKIKFGDGLTEWNKLPYLTTEIYDDTEIKEEIADIKNTLEEKANTEEVYTKEEIENLKYIDEEELIAKNYMAKDEALDEFYTKTILDTKLSEKADTKEVYTKEEVDTKLAKKLDSSTITNTYATKDELKAKANSADVYTKTESDKKYATVSSLPASTALMAGTAQSVADFAGTDVDNLKIELNALLSILKDRGVIA